MDSSTQTQVRRLRPFVWAMLVALAGAFTWVAVYAATPEALAHDVATLEWIHRTMESALLDTLVPVVTNFGGPLGVALIAALVVAACVLTRHNRAAWFIAISVLGAGALNQLLKFEFARVRPDLWQRLVVEHGFSFPSGHAMGTSAFTLAVVIVLWNTRWRIWAVVAGVLYALVIGFTRLYLGVHYPTDILGGWTAGLFWVLLVWVLLPGRRLPAHLHDRAE